MADESDEPEVAISCGADPRMYVIVGIWMTFFVGLGTFVAIRRPGQWDFLVLASGVTVLLVACVALLHMVVDGEGLRYRSAISRVTLRFDEIERVYFKTIYMNGIPTGASFWVLPTGGKERRIPIRAFPVKAAAVLFEALDRRAIVVEVPQTPAAGRMAGQIRDVQGRLFRA